MRNVILTGFMTTGKSAVGRRLAKALGYRFIDTDDVIVKKTGKAISRIFQENGEAHFRRLEREVLEDLTNAQGVVIATGGGMIVNKDNYRRLHELGPIICLEAIPEEILRRAGKGQNKRPLLAVSDPMEEITRLLNARKEAYAKADYSVDTSKMSLDEVTQVVLDYVKNL